MEHPSDLITSYVLAMLHRANSYMYPTQNCAVFALRPHTVMAASTPSSDASR